MVDEPGRPRRRTLPRQMRRQGRATLIAAALIVLLLGAAWLTWLLPGMIG